MYGQKTKTIKGITYVLSSIEVMPEDAKEAIRKHKVQGHESTMTKRVRTGRGVPLDYMIWVAL